LRRPRSVHERNNHGAPLMTSLPVRDPVGDHLLTPQNAALVLIVWGRKSIRWQEGVSERDWRS